MARWVWSDRSSPGTSPSSCWRGRSPPRWRWGTRWCSSRRSSPRSRRSSSPISAVRSDSPEASSTSSPATDAPAPRWWTTRAWTRSRSPARPRWGGSSARRPREAGRSSPSSWAGSRRSSCARTPISTAWSRAWWTRSGSTRGRSAAPAPGSWCRKASRSGWWTSSAPGWGRSGGGAPRQRRVQKGVAEGATCWQPSWSCPAEGLFYPPTLFTDVTPAATIAQVEIFGPVVVLMTFRTPSESVELANNTRYGLAASVWSENLGTALDIAPRLKAGTVWINCTNVFDAASGFGGYRESGYGREGGKEGLWEYLKAERRKGGRTEGRSEEAGAATARSSESGATPSALPPSRPSAPPPIDRPPKLYIGGKQVRPDSGYALPVLDASGRRVAEAGRGNRKDIRNAVEAAHHAGASWEKATAYNRAQVLYYFAENLAVREREFAERVSALTGKAPEDAALEVGTSIIRAFAYAAWADKYDGRVHATPFRNVTLAMNEAVGVLGLVAPAEFPLLGFLSLVLPAVAMGNAVVAVPSERWPLLATDLYQVLDTSDVPGGVINIVTGTRKELAPVLAAHDDVDGIWFFGRGAREEATEVERLSAGNMKRTWAEWEERDWLDAAVGQGEEFLREATQVKNIWVPYGA